MKLDVNALRYLSRDEFRVLTAVEMGMKNHELVPAELVDRIARLKHGGAYKNLKTLLRHKLVHHDSSKYDGYRLTYMGYDFLAINTLVRRGVIVSVGRRIGVGKESDIFEVRTEDGTILAMKLHRLGRTSFRAVKAKRDYLRHRNSYNWLYLSRLAALKEFAFMRALQDHGFPVPSAVDCNRHCVLMSLVPGYPLVQVKELEHPTAVFRTIVDLIVRLAEHGLIHCDFNEFNIMIDDDEKVTMIDFPQMVSVSHRNAQMYFDRDVDCIYKFFGKRFSRMQETPELLEDSDADSDSDDNLKPCFEAIAKKAGSLDKALAASGFTGQNQDELEKFVYTERETTDAAALDSDYSNESETEADDSMYSEELRNGLETLSEEDDNLQEASGAENHTADFVEVGFSPKTSQCIIEQPLEEGANIQPDTSMEGKDDEDSSASEDDPVLSKRIEKQRKRAIASAHGSKKHFASRNISKDRGGKKSGSAKMQMKSAFW